MNVLKDFTTATLTQTALTLLDLTNANVTRDMLETDLSVWTKSMNVPLTLTNVMKMQSVPMLL